MSIKGYLKATGKNLDSMTDLLVEMLKDLYDVEHSVMKALPMMADSAHDQSLKSAFHHHRDETEAQIRRLEQCFDKLGVKPKRETCEGISGILAEGEVLMHAKGEPHVKDAALIATAQMVEHYEIAGYGSARSFASHVNRSDIADLLQQTLKEEHETDSTLTQLAESVVNPASAAASI